MGEGRRRAIGALAAAEVSQFALSLRLFVSATWMRGGAPEGSGEKGDNLLPHLHLDN